MKKRTDILLASRNLDYDCISINETWLHPSHNDNEFIDEKYIVFRKDRKFSDVKANKGGGVLLAIHRKHDCSSVSFPEIEPLEAVCVRITLKSSCIYVYSLYIRNRLNFEQEITTTRYKNHIAALKALKLKCSPVDTIVVLGDFNLPSVEWTSDSDASEDYGFVPVIGESQSIEANLARSVTTELLESGLCQMCNFKNYAGNVLDLTYTNMPELISIEKAEMTLFPDICRDPAHNAILCTIECEPAHFQSEDKSNSRFCFKKANYEALNSDLCSLNYDELFNDTDLDTMVDRFYDKLKDLFEKHVPQATPRINNHPIWYNKTLINQRNIMNREFKKLQNRRLLNSDADDFKFTQAKLNFDNHQQQLYTAYVKGLANDRTTNPKSFWRFINGKRSTNSLPSKLKLDDQTATTNSEKANLFARYFSSVYIEHNSDNDIDSFIKDRDDSGFNSFKITDEAVYNTAHTINTSKGAGPDKIPPIFIRECAETLTKPLAMIYSRSIEECKYPDRWKLGQITPIHKNGSKSDIKNYRGVNVLSNFAKMFETIIYNQLKLIVFPLLSNNQHGFRPNKNISTNLMEMSTIINEAFEERAQVDIFYADISKAFDAVNQMLLIRKMSKFPLRNSVLNWFISYFDNKKQTVKVGESLSECFNVPSSVGQGSVLGPALFLIFFDDSDDDLLNSFIFNFADDKKIAQVIRRPEDTQTLQRSINKFIEWCDLNGLSVNLMKCKTMTFSHKKNTIRADYYIKDNLVTRTDSIRDLGVIFDPKLNFASHIEFIANKAFAMLAFVKRNCYKLFNVDVAKLLFFALVRSNLEFACQVWAPHHSKYIEALESIQKQFVRFIHPNNSANNPLNKYELRPYSTRCAELDMQLLKRRRLNTCVFFIHDIISGRLKSPQLRNQISFFTINYFTRSPEFIKLKRCRLDCTDNNPFRMACKLYNRVALSVDVTLGREKFRREVNLLPDAVFENVS